MPNGGIGKERLNRRFLISPYGFYLAPWAGRAPRLTPRRPTCPRALRVLPSCIYHGAEARHYTHVTQKPPLLFCPAVVRSYEKHEPQGNRHHRHLVHPPLPLPRPLHRLFHSFSASCLVPASPARRQPGPFEQSFITGHDNSCNVSLNKNRDR